MRHIIAAALVAIIATAPTGTGITDTGDYRVTDRASHVEMCHSDHVSPDYRASCLMDARTSWNH